MSSVNCCQDNGYINDMEEPFHSELRNWLFFGISQEMGGNFFRTWTRFDALSREAAKSIKRPFFVEVIEKSQARRA